MNNIYEYAKNHKIPVKYIYFDNDEGHYTFVTEYISDHTELSFDDLSKIFTNLDKTEFTYVYMIAMNLTQFEDINEDMLDRWIYENWNVQLENDELEYKKLLENEKIFGKYDGLNITDKKIQKAIYIYTLENKLNVSDGLDYFNNSQLGDTFLMIKFNNFYKINKTRDVSKILEKEFEELENILIYYLYHENILYKFYLNFEKNTLSIILNPKDEEFFLESILASNPDLRISDHKTISKISGTFFIHDFTFNREILSFLCINNKTFTDYLYISEISSASGNKNQFGLYYKLGKIQIIFDKNASSTKSTFKIEFKKAESLEILDSFLDLFSKLMEIYMGEIPNVVELFQEYMPYNFTDLETSLESEIKDVNFKMGISKIKNLEFRAPNIFHKGDARKIYDKCTNQPIIIEKDEIKDWENYDRKVKQLQNYHFVCPDPTNKFIYFKQIEDGRILPICSDKEKSDIKVNPKKNTSTYSKSSFKILNYGDSPGSIPNYLENILKSLSQYSNTDFVRIHNIKSSNSFIHIMLFITSEKYRNMSFDEKEIHAEKYRKKLNGKIHFEVCKQEVFDKNTEEIINIFNNSDLYLEPDLYYRIFEELFNINIFIFDYTDIVIPRHNLNFIRFKNLTRQSIIVFKHLNHCELIISRGNMQNISEINKYGHRNSVISEQIVIFDSDITELLFQIQQNKSSYYLVDTDNHFRKNSYNFVNYTQIFNKFELLSQNIDNYGKVISLTLKIKNKKITVNIPPSYPLNLPQSSTIYAELSFKKIMKYFGKTTNFDNFFVYYDIIDFKSQISIPYNLSQHDQTLEYNVFSNVKKYTNILMQLINWIWKISILENGELMNIDRWVSLYVTNTLDETQIFTYPTKLQRKLPSINSVSEALKFIKWSPFFSKKSINLYPSLYNSVVSFFKREYELIEGLPLNSRFMTIPKYLEDYFIHETDFNEETNVVIFNSKLKVTDYLQKNDTHNLILQTKIIFQQSPFIYKNELTQKIYLIQFHYSDDISILLNLCLTWFNHKINKGYTFNSKLDLNIPYLLYSLSAENYIVPIENNGAVPTSFFAEILVFGDKYAAMFPLL